MIDKQAIYEELVDGLIEYQWRLENPFPFTGMNRETSQPPWTHAYQNDPIFSHKVKQLASGIMGIVNKHIDKAGA